MTDQKHTKGQVALCKFGEDSKEFGLHFPDHPLAVKSDKPHPYEMKHAITLCRGMDGPNGEINANHIMELWNHYEIYESPLDLRAKLDAVTKQRDEAIKLCSDLIAGNAGLKNSRDELRDAIEFAVNDLKNCDWSCHNCGTEQGMDETDLFDILTKALTKTKEPV